MMKICCRNFKFVVIYVFFSVNSFFAKFQSSHKKVFPSLFGSFWMCFNGKPKITMRIVAPKPRISKTF